MRPVTDLQRKVAPFEVISEYQPSGDQPTAIEDIVRRVTGGEQDVVLPDVGLEQHLVLGAGDGGEHVLEEVTAVGVARHRPGADGDLTRLGGLERPWLLAAASVGVNERERDREADLQPEDAQDGPA